MIFLNFPERVEPAVVRLENPDRLRGLLSLPPEFIVTTERRLHLQEHATDRQITEGRNCTHLVLEPEPYFAIRGNYIYDVDHFDVRLNPDRSLTYRLIGRCYEYRIGELLECHRAYIDSRIKEDTRYQVDSDFLLSRVIRRIPPEFLGYGYEVRTHVDREQFNELTVSLISPYRESLNFVIGLHELGQIRDDLIIFTRNGPLAAFWNLYRNRHVELPGREFQNPHDPTIAPVLSGTFNIGYVHIDPASFEQSYTGTIILSGTFSEYYGKTYSDEAEENAQETLKRLIGEQEFKHYKANGFVQFNGRKFTYRIYKGNKMTDCYKGNKLKERRCLVIEDQEIPPTDSLITRYLMLKTNEKQFLKEAIKWRV